MVIRNCISSLSNAYIFFFRIVLFVLNFFEYYGLSAKVLKHYRTYISKYEMDTIIVLQSMKKLLVRGVVIIDVVHSTILSLPFFLEA